MDKIAKLEAIVFSEGGEVSVKQVLKVLHIGNAKLVELIKQYNNSKRGMVLVLDTKRIIMRVSGEFAEVVERVRGDTIKDGISKAGLEVLSIVLYSPDEDISASEIESIRGVNSAHTLRHLTMRGLLSKMRSKSVDAGARGVYKYSTTPELLAVLGVTQKEDLPDFLEIRKKISDFIKNNNDID